MKRFFAAAALILLAAGISSAQSLGEAAELFDQGRTAFSEGNKTGAVDFFTKALEMASQLGEEGESLVSDCKQNISNIQYSILTGMGGDGDYDGAIALYDQVVKTATEYGQDEVLEQCKELLPNLYAGKGKALFEAENFEGAVPVFQKVLELNPADANSAARLGQALSKLNRLTEAKDAYLKAQENGLDVSKPLGNTVLKLAQAALKDKKFVDAYNLAIESAGYAENASAYQIAGSAAQQAKKFKDAISAYEKFISLKPDAPAQIKYNLATCYKEAGNKAKAIEYYKMVTGDSKYGANATQLIKQLSQ